MLPLVSLPSFTNEGKEQTLVQAQRSSGLSDAFVSCTDAAVYGGLSVYGDRLWAAPDVMVNSKGGPETC